MIKKILILVIMSQLATTSWVQASDPDPNDDVGKECSGGSQNSWMSHVNACSNVPGGVCSSAGEIVYGTADTCCSPPPNGSCSGNSCNGVKSQREDVNGEQCKLEPSTDIYGNPTFDCVVEAATLKAYRPQCY